ncbi:MAG: cytochrome c maturation protein CcmE [Dokdonella sp.]
MTPTRRRRLIVVSLVLAAVAIAGGLTVLALQQNMTYLFSPSEIEAGRAPVAARFRLGGVVLEKSIKRANDSLEVDFVVTDRFKEMPVEYTGILPDLFREGQSVVASGALQNGHFIASEVLAKHDETYMPKEVADAIAKAKQAHVDHADAATPAGGSP